MDTYTQTPLKESYLKLPPLKRDCRTTIPDMVKEITRENPDKLAFVFRSPDQPRATLTRKELLDQSSAMAQYFVRLGIEVGDKVGVLVRSGKEWMTVQFGLYMAGAIAVNLMSDDVNGTAGHVGCVAMIVDADRQSTPEIQQDTQQLKISFINKEQKSSIVFDTPVLLNKSDGRLPFVSPEDPAMMFFTSGSSGVPKLVTNTHKAVVIEAISYWQGLGSSSDDIILNDRPLGWSGGYPWLFLAEGCTYVYVMSRLNDSEEGRFYIDVILSESATVCFMTEYRLNSLGKDLESLARFPRIKSMIASGQRVTQAHIQRMLDFCDTVIYDYSSTECMHAFFGTCSDALTFEDGTAGFCPGGCEAKIVSDDGKTVPITETGELWLRGDGCAKEYLLLDGSRQRVLDSDGWYHTKDVAILKPDGMLVILGRTSEIIKRATVKIVPSVVERMLNDALDVLDVAVVGIPEDVCACVLLKPGSTLTNEQIRLLALDVFKPSLAPDGLGLMPGHFLILDSFPRTATSKCHRPKLAKIAEDILRSKEKP